MSNQSIEKNDNKNKTIPMTSKDVSVTPSVTEPLTEEVIPQIEENMEVVKLLLTYVPEANDLRQQLQSKVHGNQFIKTSTADSMMLLWAQQQANAPLYCLLEDILTELRELNGKKPVATEEKRKVGRPRKE